MGGSGGGSAPPQQATPPTLDLAQTTGLTQAGLNLLRSNIGPISEAYGAANRSQETFNRFYGLRSLTDPGEDLGRAMEDELTPRIAEAQRELAQLERLKPTTDKRTGEIGYIIGKGKDRQFVSEADYNTRKANAERNLERYNEDLNQARDYDPVAELTNTFRDQYAMRDSFLGDMRSNIDSTSEYGRFQDALGRGVAVQEADMERMRAEQTDQSAIGQRLMAEAQRKMDQGGQLSPEAQREAVQSARQGFAARGMATGSAALGAELLNRDRYSRQREFENLGFARSVNADDLARRQANTNLRQQAGLQNAQAFNQLSQFNAGQRDANNRYNLGLLGQSTALADAERNRKLAIQQDMYNFAMGTDPRMMLAGLGSPYANMTSPAAANMTALAATTQPIYSGGSFSPQRMPQAGGGGWNWGGVAAGAASGAVAGSALGPYGAAGGAIIGGVAGGFS